LVLWQGIEGGWETVGDLGHMDAEGYIYLADRKTDMVLVRASCPA
jgi:bile acid-coenzyme A ligase